MSEDALGERMKAYESVEAGRRLMPLLPALARIDGRCFSAFTRGMRRPFDARLSRLMIETARWLVEETGACVGYTQSDEISLAWLATSYDSEIFFAGRIQKMVSQLAALATAHFNAQLGFHFDGLDFKIYPTFDARVWSVPNIDEGANTFLWREIDATKNSVSMAAREHFSHKQLHGLGRADQMDLLHSKGVNWNDYPAFFKRGTYIQRRTVKRKLTVEDIEKLPPLHDARKNPELEIERSEYVELELPPLSKVVNRAQVLFHGEAPKTE